MQQPGTDPLTDAQLAEMRERCEKATPGSWLYEDRAAPPFVATCARPYEPIGSFNRCEDCEFVVTAKDDVPALLAEVDRLRAENEALKSDLAAKLAPDMDTQGDPS